MRDGIVAVITEISATTAAVPFAAPNACALWAVMANKRIHLIAHIGVSAVKAQQASSVAALALAHLRRVDGKNSA